MLRFSLFNRNLFSQKACSFPEFYIEVFLHVFTFNGKVETEEIEQIAQCLGVLPNPLFKKNQFSP